MISPVGHQRSQISKPLDGSTRMKKGLCNICGKARPLTRDHIFPLSTVSSRSLEVRTLAQDLSCEPLEPQLAQASVERRTICEECNSSRLGNRYDPYLKEFSERVASWIRARYEQHLTLPSNFTVKLKPNRVIRAIVGHLLAAEARPRRFAPLVHAPMPDAMRDFFLDKSKELPSELEVFCWPYPSDMQVVIRSAGIGQYGFRHFVTSDFMKAFPLAYWLTWERPKSVSVSLSQIPSSRLLNDEKSVEISLENVPPVDWPERPRGYDMLLVNNSMTILCKRRV